jgi:hypothetical protein
MQIEFPLLDVDDDVWQAHLLFFSSLLTLKKIDDNNHPHRLVIHSTSPCCHCSDWNIRYHAPAEVSIQN